MPDDLNQNILKDAFQAYFASLADPTQASFPAMIAFTQKRAKCSLKSINGQLGFSWSNFHHHYSQGDGRLPKVTIATIADNLNVDATLRKNLESLERNSEISKEQTKTYVLEYLTTAGDNARFDQMIGHIRRAHFTVAHFAVSERAIRDAFGFSHNNFYHHLHAEDGKLPPPTLRKLAKAVGINIKSLQPLKAEGFAIAKEREKAAVAIDLYVRGHLLQDTPPKAWELLESVYQHLEPLNLNRVAQVLDVSRQTLARYMEMKIDEFYPVLHSALSKVSPSFAEVYGTRHEKGGKPLFTPPTRVEVEMHSHAIQYALIAALTDEPKTKCFGEALQKIRDTDFNFVLIGNLASALGIQPIIVRQHLENKNMPLNPKISEVICQHVAQGNAHFSSELSALLMPLTRGHLSTTARFARNEQPDHPFGRH